MHRLLMPLLIFYTCLYAASALAQTTQPSDAQAISLARQSIAALTRGTPVSDITLYASVTSVLGSENETGTGTFSAKGTDASRVDLNFGSGTRSDVHSMSNGLPAGGWQKNSGAVTPYAQHNCWTDAAWFFPPLSSLTQTANPNFVFKYVAQEQHGGIAVQHIRVLQFASSSLSPQSTTDFYLDVNSYLPMAIAPVLYADNDINTTIPNEIRFANWQAVNGVQVPFHFQRMLNGLVVLDVTVTGVNLNSGLSSNIFSLP